jgi:hypothetical protein
MIAVALRVASSASPAHAAGLLVLTLTGEKVCAMTVFDTSPLPHFGLPRTLP